jgi:uncharacterized protein (UPF0248 family)
MVPIQDVLHRIQWDPAWRASLFEIGYLDRVAGTVVRVLFEDLRVESGGPSALALRERDGAVVGIPLHRVRTVWRDGVIVWERRPGEALQSPDGAS